MEANCLTSHGLARFLKERLFDVSDAFRVVVCKKCEMMTGSPTSCHICGGDNVEKVNIPYASKLLFHELNALGIKIKIKPKV